MNKVLVIVGNGRSRTGAPYGDPARDIWMVNNHALYADKQPAALFEMHPDALTDERYTQEYKQWLQQPHPFPIYTHGYMQGVPASVPYPQAQITHAFGRNIWKGSQEVTEHFSSTFPYMFALGIYKGYPEIEVYGVDLYEPTYQKYRESVYFWLGIASQLGVTVTIPEQSELIAPHLYPFY